MNERIINILLDSQRNYNASSLKEIRKIESYFKLDSIDINKLGDCIKSINEDIAIKIIDIDHNILYESKCNDELDKIGNTVLKCRHCSIYPLIMYSIGFMDISFFNDDNILPISIGMPIYINNELKYIIESNDSINTLIKGLSKYLNKELDLFEGYII